MNLIQEWKEKDDIFEFLSEVERPRVCVVTSKSQITYNVYHERKQLYLKREMHIVPASGLCYNQTFKTFSYV